MDVQGYSRFSVNINAIFDETILEYNPMVIARIVTKLFLVEIV
jgi:hypothetical protein